MSTRRRPRTVACSLEERGQTTQDFAIGIGIFLLAIAFVFGFVPTFLTPFTPDVGQAESAQADRIADRIAGQLSEGDRYNHVESDDEFEALVPDDDDVTLAENLGLRTAGEDADVVPVDRVNVTLETLDGDDVVLSGGHHLPDDQATASAARIVTYEGDTVPDPDAAYRIVVRVW